MRSTQTVPKLAMVDLSSNNGAVDLKRMWDAGFRVLCLKATEGTTYLWDESHVLAQQWHRFGGIVLHYHFLHPGHEADGVAQANFFWMNVQHSLGVGDRVVVDVETQGESGAESGAFMDRMHDLAPHLQGLVYGPPYFLRDNQITPRHRWGLWIADYQPPIDFIPPGWSDWTAWQFTSTGKVPGVQNPCDVSHIRRELIQPTLRQGQSCFAVEDAAVKLRHLGYRGFLINDSYGAGKAQAVHHFKKDRGWKNPVGSVMGPVFWAALNKAR